MLLGIMGAMPEEMDKIIAAINHKEIVESGSRIYYRGDLYGQDVVAVFSRWGKVAAATTATNMILHFKVDRIVFTGVAGAISHELNVGDIVIGQRLYQHDMDARPLMRRKILSDHNISNPKMLTGDIASGDLFISSTEMKHALIKNLPSVLCAEMEGAAVAQVCDDFGVPLTVVRVISDTADEEAHISAIGFVNQHAGDYSLSILKEYINLIQQ